METVREAFEEAVRGHLEADVPVGAFLSGGLDSTAIVGTLAKIGVTPKTFTVCFAEGDDESAAARLAAERAGAEHHEIRLSRDEVLAMVPEAVARMDSPSADGVNTYIVSKAVHDQGMKVALSGLGGDELFGGYPSFARARSAWGRILGATPRGVRALPEWIVAGVAGYSTRLGKLADVLGGTGSMTDLYLEGRALFSRGQVERLTGERAPEHPRRGELLELEGRLAGDRSKGGRRPPSIGPEARPAGLTFISHAEIRTYMHDTLLRDTDQMSMAHSLEVRVPFLDGPFAELVLSLPDEVKFAGTGPKPLLVRAFADRIPEELHRLPKRGFTLPMDAWMRGALREYCLERITSAALEDAGVDRGEAMKVWRAFETGRARWSRAWALVVLADWRGKSEMKNGK